MTTVAEIVNNQIVLVLGEAESLTLIAAARASALGSIDTAGTTKVAAVNAAGATQVAAVNSAGGTQVGLVNGAGTTQVAAVNAAGSTQAAAVNAAGTTQAAAVNSAGTTQVAAVNTAGSTQTAAVNAAGATQVSDIRATAASDMFASEADALSMGVASVAVTAGGSGGTNGTYAWTTTGGGGTGASGYLTVAGGAITSVVREARGRGYTSDPTLVYTVTGLTGQTLTVSRSQNKTAGQYFTIPGAVGDTNYQVDAGGTTATRQPRDSSLNAARRAARLVLETALAAGFSYGNAGTLTTGSAATAPGTYAHATAIARAGVVKTVRLYSTSAGVITLRRFTKSGNTYTQVSDSLPGSIAVTVPSTGSQSIDIPEGFQMLAGEYLGWSVSTSGVLLYTNATTDEGGYYATGSSTTAFTDATLKTAAKFQLAFDLIYATVTDARLTADEVLIAKGTAAYNALKRNAYQRIGRTTTPVIGTAVEDRVWLDGTPVAATGELTSFVGYFTAGAVKIVAFTKSGDTFTERASFTATATGGLQTFVAGVDYSTFALQANDYLAVYCGTRGYYTNGQSGSPAGGYSPASTGYQSSFTDSSAQTGFTIQIAYTVRYDQLVVPTSLTRSGARFPCQVGFIDNGGQSNGEGANGTAITTAQEYDNVGFAARATAPLDFIALTTGNTQYSTYGESPMYGSLGFQKELILRELGVAYADNDFLLVGCNNAVSGQSITALKKGQTPFTNAMAQLTAAFNIATGRSVAMLSSDWTQGEQDGDASMSRATYKGHLKTYADDKATDAKAITSQTFDPILIVGQLSSSGGNGVAATHREIAYAQLEAANEHPLIYLAGPTYHLTFYDGQHFNAAGKKDLGALYGLVRQRVLIDRVGWEPLRPMRQSVIGGVIDLFFTKDGLTFDNTTVPAQTNSGFTAVDSGGSAIALSAVAIKGTDRVRLTRSSGSWVPGDKILYGAANMTGRSDSFVGGGGNLRDSQGDRLKYVGHSSAPLHNWCVLFEWEV